jgi:phage/plasmid-like protein (TIGR03299 family)
MKDTIINLKNDARFHTEQVDAITLENSGINWTVSKRNLFYNCGESNCDVKGWQAVVRDDSNAILHIAKDSYTIVQNHRLWQCLENSLLGIGYQIVRTGTFQNGRKVFIQIALNDAQDYLANGDKFKNYLTFVTSHDGQIPVSAFDTSIRIICLNSLKLSMRNKGMLNLTVSHTKNSEIRMEKMEQEIDELLVKRAEFYTSIEYLMNKPMTVDYANKVLTGFVANGDELSTRAENQVDELVGLFQNGKGNNGKTYADALNAVTEYYTFHASDNKQKLFVSNEIGSAGEKKVEFYDLLMNDDELNQLAARGDALLKARQQAVVVA